MRTLVLGGAGFIGRHAVAGLLGRQHEVIIGSRYPERAARRLLLQAHRLPSREIELGGAAQMTIREYLARLRVEQCGANTRPATTVAIPHSLARIGSHVCDLLHVTPFSFGHLQLMQHDNVPRVNYLPQLLQVTGKTQEK